MPQCCVLSGKPPQFEPFPEPSPGDSEAIVHVRAAALKAVDKQLASGSHHASTRTASGVRRGRSWTAGGWYAGVLRRATTTVRRNGRRAQCFPVPDDVDDRTAAAIPNPGVSAWLSLQHRAKLAPGETVLILGATGVTGKLAGQITKILRAGRVVAAGRDEQVLSTLQELGAEATIRLDRPDRELIEAIRREAGDKGFDVIVDYLWGPRRRRCWRRSPARSLRSPARRRASFRWGERRANHHPSRGRPAEHPTYDLGDSRRPPLGGAHRCLRKGDEACGERQAAHRRREGPARRHRGSVGTRHAWTQGSRDPVALVSTWSNLNADSDDNPLFAEHRACRRLKADREIAGQRASHLGWYQA
jgi:hypothetical protein